MGRFLLLTLLLFSLNSNAGKISNISFDDSKITIRHNGCQLKQPLNGKRKLILPLENCINNSGKITVLHDKLKQVHWGQHDQNTVWVVATFSKEYQVELESSSDQVEVCIPFCKPSKRITSKLKTLNKSRDIMFLLKDMLFKIPLENMKINEFLDLSIGYIPKDVIRDGLPHFGAKRDDWKRKPRKHKGYDIYINNINVLASAEGTVVKIGRSYRAGLYVKLHHDSQIDTVYVHLMSASVTAGQKVKQGDIIGRIAGPVGNAISPQLHFEIKLRNESIDPLPLIEHFYQDDSKIIRKIKKYKKSLLQSIRHRNEAVRNFLESK